MSIKKAAIFGSVRKPGFVDSCQRLFCVLEREGVRILLQEKVFSHLSAGQPHLLPQVFDIVPQNGDFQADLVFSLGGDGTFLKTAIAVQHRNIPIVGIKLGHLGFLVDIAVEELETAVQEVLQQGFQVEPRSLLSLQTDGRPFSKGPSVALNEVAVMKLDSSSMIKVHTTVNGEFLCTYRADGLLISTPTGSTAYAMSVGASILCPQNQSFILSPISPHSLNQRPLVIPDDWVTELEITCRGEQYMVALDGRSQVMPKDTRLTIRKADYSIWVAKRKGHTFFQTLRDKLMWGSMLGQ